MDRVKSMYVPVFTENGVWVYYGAWGSVNAAIERKFKKAKLDIEHIRADDERGATWNCYPEHDPIIGVENALRGLEAIAVLAHEASHAMDFISKRLGLNDASGEFRAHGIAAIVASAGGLVSGGRV